jgi:hypothetical protein
MKCNLCGAVHEDDNLYFCITCGAMLKNPVTGEYVKENIGEASKEASDISDNETSTENISADIPTEPEQDEILEISPDILPEPEELPEPEPVKEEKIFSTKAIKDTPPAEPAPEIPREELHIAKEREKATENTAIPPVQEETAPVEEAPQNPEKVSAGKIFGAGVVSLITIIILTAVGLLFSLKLGFTGDNLHNIAKDLNKWSIINARMDGLTVSDNLYYKSDFDKATHNFADTTDFALFLAKTDFTGFCADKLEVYADYIIDGKGDEPTLTENEIVDFFKENHDIAKETFGYDLQTADYNSMRTSLANNETAEKFSVSKIGWDLRFRLENIRYILSYLTLGILAAIVALLMIWIATLVNCKGKHIIGFFGNIFTFSGLAVILVSVAVSAGAALAHTVTGDFLCYLSSTLLLPTAVYGICIGAILLIAGLIIKKVKASVRTKEKIQKAINNR